MSSAFLGLGYVAIVVIFVCGNVLVLSMCGHVMVIFMCGHSPSAVILVVLNLVSSDKLSSRKVKYTALIVYF